MVSIIRPNLAQQSDWKGLEDREVRRVVLPNFRNNPLLVNSADSSSAQWVEGYKSLRTQIMKAHVTSDVRSLAVTSVEHSDGKSLTSFNLACTCAQLEKASVLLVDADLRTQGLSKLVGDLPSPGLADFLNGTSPCEDIPIQTDLTGLSIVCAGRSHRSPAELFSSEKWQEFMTWARDHFQLVIVDSLPVCGLADADLIAGVCDRTLMVVRALKTSRAGLEEALEHLDVNKILGVVWNGAHKSPKYYAYDTH